MSKPKLTVALVVGENCAGEANAIRQVLEYFEVKIITFFIGRPSDFIDILNGKSLYADINHIILCFHGKAEKFVMPILAKDIYETDEPRGNFGADEIEKFAKLKDKIILTTGCTLGKKGLAKAFLNSECKAFIGAKDYIEANSALFFIIHFYYELLANQRTEKDAFEIAKAPDSETKLFQFYE
jgi:hypothetical protein